MSEGSNCTFHQASQHQYLLKCACGKIIEKKLKDFSAFLDGQKIEQNNEQQNEEYNKVYEEEKPEDMEEVCHLRKSISFHPSRTAILMLREQNRKNRIHLEKRVGHEDYSSDEGTNPNCLHIHRQVDEHHMCRCPKNDSKRS